MFSVFRRLFQTIFFIAFVFLMLHANAKSKDDWFAGLQPPPGSGPGEAVDLKKNKVLFQGVNIFDGKHPTLKKNMYVLVVGNVIQMISKSPIKTETGTVIIHAKGKTLMPGLIDSHVHLAIPDIFGNIKEYYTIGEVHLRGYLAARYAFLDGFTTVRDEGGPVFGLKRVIDSGQLIGPRIYPSGRMISQTSGHGDFRVQSAPDPFFNKDYSTFTRFGITRIANGRSAVLAATRENLMMGASQIKIMAGGGGSSIYDPIYTTQYTFSEMQAAVQAASDYGTYVSAHIFTPKAAKRFISAGGKSIEHGFFLDEASIKLAAQKGVFLVPQFWGISPELFKNPNVPKTKHKAIRKMVNSAKQFVPLLLKYKVKVAFASDLVGPIPDAIKSRRYEIWWRSQLFKSNFEVLKQLTSIGGELMALTGQRNPYPGKIGVIEKGALADILVINGNPLEDLSVLGAQDKWYADKHPPKPINTIVIIMKNGIIYKNTLDNLSNSQGLNTYHMKSFFPESV